MPVKLLYSDSCGGCREAKEELAEQIKSGEIELVKVESEEGAELMDRAKVQYIPQPLLIDGDKIKKCKLKYNKDDELIVDCGNGK